MSQNIKLKKVTKCQEDEYFGVYHKSIAKEIMA